MLRTVDRKVRSLAGLPILAGCQRGELVDLARQFDVSLVEPGVTLDSEETVSRWWTLIAEGTALATRDGRTTGHLGAGDFFGERGVLGRERSTVTVVSVTPMMLLVLDGRRLRELVRRFPVLGDRVLTALARRPAPYDGSDRPTPDMPGPNLAVTGAPR